MTGVPGAGEGHWADRCFQLPAPLAPVDGGDPAYQLTLSCVLKTAAPPEKFDLKMDTWHVNFTFRWEPQEPQGGLGRTPLRHR